MEVLGHPLLCKTSLEHNFAQWCASIEEHIRSSSGGGWESGESKYSSLVHIFRVKSPVRFLCPPSAQKTNFSVSTSIHSSPALLPTLTCTCKEMIRYTFAPPVETSRLFPGLGCVISSYRAILLTMIMISTCNCTSYIHEH